MSCVQKLENNCCEKSCHRNCLQNISYYSVLQFRSKFWENEPTPSQRRKLMMDEVRNARTRYLEKVANEVVDPKQYPKQLIFCADGVELCEQAFVNMLSVCTVDGYRSKTWISIVDEVVNGKSAHKCNKFKKKKYAKDIKMFKRDHAYSYQKSVVESEVMDRSAFADHSNHYYLPYATERAFYGEYAHWCKAMNIVERAQEATFKRAFKMLIEDKAKDGIYLRLSGGKGSFDKCDICHNADQLLRKSNNWSEVEIGIIESYRRQHISQQFEERMKLQSNIAETYKTDHLGQPVKALLFADGMTVYRGNRSVLSCVLLYNS